MPKRPRLESRKTKLRTTESSEGSTSASGSQGDVVPAEVEPVPQIVAEGEEATAGGNTAFTATSFLEWAWDKRRHFLAATLFISLCLNTSHVAADYILNFGHLQAVAQVLAYWQHCNDQKEIKTLISKNQGVLDLILDATSNGFAEKNAKAVQSLKEKQEKEQQLQAKERQLHAQERQLHAQERQLQAQERQLSKDRYAYMMRQLGLEVPRELLE